LGINLAVPGFKADAGINTRTALGNQLTQIFTIKGSPDAV